MQTPLCFVGCLVYLLDSAAFTKQSIATAKDPHRRLDISTQTKINFSQVHVSEEHFEIKSLYYEWEGS